MQQDNQKISKFLSYILRHQPQAIGITLDSQGWVCLDQLVKQANIHGQALTHQLIEHVVAGCDKQRFTLSADRQKIRAAQGHSTTQVQIEHTKQNPPQYLYHGTASRFISSIKQQGLIAGARHYVHLSSDVTTAYQVGSRYGQPVILKIKAGLMSDKGSDFYLADNGVWLTQSVDIQFIEINQ